VAAPLVLIVEDDEALIALLQYNLERGGFRTAMARDGEEALTRAAETPPDVILLDWMVPLISGIELCRQFRRSAALRTVPIIMVTARGEEADRIRGLETGADDYMTKPFSPQELVARIRALLRRSQPGLSQEILTYKDVTMDLAAHRVHRGRREIVLGPTEFRLLKYLLQHPERVFSREQLMDKVWGQDIYVEIRTVDVHIRRLRKALNDDNAADLIRTVRSAGYALAGESAAPL